MKENDLLKIYGLLPVWMQNIACSIYANKMAHIRYNDLFFKCLEKLQETQFYSKSEIEAYQNERLKHIISEAYQNTKYYNELFHKLKLKPSDIKTTDDLYKIPILTKAIYRERPADFLNAKIDKRKFIWGTTSGSTGMPLSVAVSDKTEAMKWAVWWRFRSQYGIKFGDKHLCIVGAKLLIPKDQKKPPFWRFLKAYNQCYVNSYQITPEKIKYLVDLINQEKFVFISGYPTQIYRLALLIQDGHYSINSTPKAILTGGEKTLNYQKELLEEVFQCPVSDHYGFAEATANASKCKLGNYHEDFEMGILECDNNRIQLSENEYAGKIITTTLINDWSPLIRYEIGDYAIWSTETCKCGRQSKVIKEIQGRSIDLIHTPDGNALSKLSTDEIFMNAKGIVETQLVQETPDEIIVKIVKSDLYSEKDEKTIVKNIAKLISPKLNVKFQYVKPDEIVRNASGKFKFLISSLN